MTIYSREIDVLQYRTRENVQILLDTISALRTELEEMRGHLRLTLPAIEHVRDEAIRLGTRHDQMDKLICDILQKAASHES